MTGKVENYFQNVDLIPATPKPTKHVNGISNTNYHRKCCNGKKMHDPITVIH
jgi:hypothetical protein